MRRFQISYVNGRYLRHSEAMIHIDDRGYQFSDGIYEVLSIKNSALLDSALHFKRLKRSLKELSIPMDFSIEAMKIIIKELARRNNLKDGLLYIQITRGVARRDHPFPKKPLRPSLIITLSPPKSPSQKEYDEGVKVITRQDIRWGRKDIKSISLLANILAKQEAIKAKAKETWLIDGNGNVTEGSASNGFIFDKAGTLHTHPANEGILGGITRHVVMELAKKNGIKIMEKPFTLKAARQAKEAFMTSTTAGVLPIIKIDEKNIGNGKPGELTKKLMELYNAHTRKQCK